jgi:hypothetical protein
MVSVAAADDIRVVMDAARSEAVSGDKPVILYQPGIEPGRGKPSLANQFVATVP